MPWKIVEEEGQFCVWKEDADGNPTEKLKCYEDRDEALAYQRALYANESETSELVRTINLAEGDIARPVEFLRIGTFVDANGRTVEIDTDKLDALVSSFEQGQAGQDVPIDILHKREEAAGWVRSVYRQADKLFAVPEWNNLGRQLVGDKVYRYLSATIDLTRNVLRSISLVNFPAVKGLSPVELNEDVTSDEQQTVSDAAPPSQLTLQETGQETALAAPTHPTEDNTMAEEQKVVQPETELAAPPTPTPASAVLTEADIAALRKSVEDEVRATLMAELQQIEASKVRVMAELMEQVREERALAEFSQAATSEGRFALPFKRDELQSFLAELPKAHRNKVIEFMRTIIEVGTVDFTEHGTARGGAVKKLDADDDIALRRHLASGGSLDVFFAANTELGPKSDYDLKEYSNG